MLDEEGRVWWEGAGSVLSAGQCVHPSYGMTPSLLLSHHVVQSFCIHVPTCWITCEMYGGCRPAIVIFIAVLLLAAHLRVQKHLSNLAEPCCDVGR